MFQTLPNVHMSKTAPVENQNFIYMGGSYSSLNQAFQNINFEKSICGFAKVNCFYF
jgi:hypothetical protein